MSGNNRSEDDQMEVGIMVVLTVPRRMVASLEKELATCIGFGKPVITTIYDVPAARPVTDLPGIT